jgi:hypothetical protein
MKSRHLSHSKNVTYIITSMGTVVINMQKFKHSSKITQNWYVICFQATKFKVIYIASISESKHSINYRITNITTTFHGLIKYYFAVAFFCIFVFLYSYWDSISSLPHFFFFSVFIVQSLQTSLAVYKQNGFWQCAL